MDLVRATTNWNSHYGDKLRLSAKILQLTFAPDSNQTPLILNSDAFEILCKLESVSGLNTLRIHLPVPIRETLETGGEKLISFLRTEALKRNCKKIIFGAGDNHLFPGVPLYKDLGLWLRWIFPKGKEVMDFGAELSDLRRSEQTRCEGTLRSGRNVTEYNALLEFVLREFPGRWSRDILNDSRNNLLNHYFGYFIEESIQGYVRLYGWDNEYWGPGTYFALPGENVGGLGPIGVAAEKRERGYGGQILKLAWETLIEKGCSSVRVDWTTEIEFYQKRGLHIVQRYQPASLDL